ncbi:hypothetical protein [Mycolicibacterium novocastrense]|nr:hypothetical protein [Mycolicibacterium novocastrense]
MIDRSAYRSADLGAEIALRNGMVSTDDEADGPYHIAGVLAS